MASRLRARQVICTTGSSPSCTTMVPAPMLDMRTMAVWLSVRLTASTRPRSSLAFSRMASASALCGGPSSPVTAKWPPRKTRSSLDPDLNPLEWTSAMVGLLPLLAVLCRQAQVLAGDFARPAVPAGRPVLGRLDLQDQVQPILRLELVVDQLPGAGGVRIARAAAARGPPARPVERLLGAAGDRADPAGQAQDAVAASGAALLPHALLGGQAHEAGVEPGNHHCLREALGQRLGAHAAAQREHHVCLADLLGQRIDVLPLALALHGGVGDGLAVPVQLGSHAQAAGQDAGLLLAAGETHRHAGAAADHQHLLRAGNQALDLLKWLLLCNDHGSCLSLGDCGDERASIGRAPWGRSGLGPSSAIRCVVSCISSANCLPMAEDRFTMLSRPGSNPICSINFLTCSTRRLAFTLPSR